MKLNQVIILSVCGLILLGLGLWYLADRPPAPAALASRALSASAPKERLDATVELSMAKDQKQAMAELKRVAKDTKDPAVQVLALKTLAANNQSDSLDLFWAAMLNSDRSVREAGSKGVQRLLEGVLPAELTYDPDASPEVREMVVGQMKEAHKKWLESQPKT